MTTSPETQKPYEKNRSKRIQGVVGKGHQVRVGRDDLGGGEPEGISIRLAGADQGGANRGAPAGLILRHHRHPQDLFDFGGQRPAGDV